VGFTPKTETAIATEAKRLGISFADQVRRITDNWADNWAAKQGKAPEKILVLDRDTGVLRGVR
jgi:hypothetical protein